MRHIMPRILWISLLYFLLVACATVAPPAPSTQQLSWNDRAAALSRIHSWQLNGKIAVQMAQNSGSASINWLQNGGRFTISLTGPLGAGALKLSGKPGLVVADTSDGKHFTSNSTDQLLAQQWGWNLPVSDMNYWVRGLPAPNSPSQSHFDTSHRLSSLTQQGWNIQFISYTNADSIDLPSKIYLTSPAVKAKIIIYMWNTHISH